ncbi:MAG: glycosyltransferase [Proteobacteria bacterium]|nr:glycosyltransferase [Pseudomonadota bacterium]
MPLDSTVFAQGAPVPARRLRCLWIARYIPYPLDAGAKVYSAKLAESLAAQGAQVRFLGIGNGDGIPAGSSQVDWTPIGNLRRSNLRALFSRLPNAAAVDATDTYIQSLQQQLDEDWDVIVLDGYGTGWALDLCTRYRARRATGAVNLVHVSHNHEERLWRSMVRDSRTSPLRKCALWQNYRKVRRLERQMVGSADLLTTVTDEDAETLGATARRLTLTPGYDGQVVRARRIGTDTPRRVILMGSFHWVVKQENLRRFIELADPTFAQHGIELDVVGMVPDALLSTLQRRVRATRFHGFVDDATSLLADARIAVVPEAIGGGFKLKFLDYFFARVPVATLTQAAAGLPQEIRQQTLSCASLPQLVASMVSHIDRLDELNQMQEQCFNLSSARFRWPDRGRTLINALSRQ